MFMVPKSTGDFGETTTWAAVGRASGAAEDSTGSGAGSFLLHPNFSDKSVTSITQDGDSSLFMAQT
jgi:hypothetical protein